MKKVAVIVGSLRKDSSNKKLAKTFESLAADKLEFNYVDVNLPLFNEDIESNPGQAVEAARKVVADADVVLMITPEYNRGITGVLKNAIDWLSRPYAAGVIQGKPVAIAGVSGGTLGTGPAQAGLRGIVGYLNMPLMGQPEFYLNAHAEDFNEDGILKETSHAQKYVDALTAFANK